MNLNQREILIKLNSKKNYGIIYENNPFDILIHSVLNTVKFDNLIQIYLNNELQELKKSIFSNIDKRVSLESNIETIYESLKELKASENNYYYSQRLRMVLEILLQNLPKEYKVDYFNTYFYSKYLNDKKSVLKYLKYSNKNVDNNLLELYIATKNLLFLNPILKIKNNKLITAKFYKIWETDLQFYYKKRIIESIIPLESEIENFIKDKEPDVYFHLQLIRHKINKKDFIDKIENTPVDKRPLYIWQASRHLKFETLEQSYPPYQVHIDSQNRCA